MSTIRKTLENAEQAKTAIFDPAVKNVRFGSYDAEKKRVFWLVSATRFPQGFTLRMDRKAFAKKLTAAEAIETLLKTVNVQIEARNINADLVRFETWVDSDRAARLDTKTTEASETTETPAKASATVTLSREAAAELLGITRNALSKRIRRAGGELTLESGEVVS